MDMRSIEVPFPKDPDNAISFVIEVQMMLGKPWWTAYTKFKGVRQKIGHGPATDADNGERQGMNQIYIWLDSQMSQQSRMNRMALA